MFKCVLRACCHCLFRTLSVDIANSPHVWIEPTVRMHKPMTIVFLNGWKQLFLSQRATASRWERWRTVMHMRILLFRIVLAAVKCGQHWTNPQTLGQLRNNNSSLPWLPDKLACGMRQCGQSCQGDCLKCVEMWRAVSLVWNVELWPIRLNVLGGDSPHTGDEMIGQRIKNSGHHYYTPANEYIDFCTGTPYKGPL